MDEITESHFAGDDLGIRQTGFAYFRIKPGKRQPFGHYHDRAEEVYFVAEGSGRVKLDDEVKELTKGNFLRVGPEVTRCFEAGDDGMEILAFGQKHEGDGGISPGWWTD